MKPHCTASALGLFLLLLASAAVAAEYTLEVNDQARTFKGTTLFAETKDQTHPRLVEVDMNGAVVWEYSIPKNIVRGGHPGQAMDVEWLPATDTILFVMPFKGIFEVNRDKEIIWEYRTKRVSHDADRLPNGNTLFSFAWESQSDAQVTEITPNGDVVWQWFAKDHIDPALRRYPGPVKKDGFCHVNGVIRLDNGLTRISLRNFNTVVEVDGNGDITWLLNTMKNGREVRNVHDPRTLPNGNIILSTHAPQVIIEVTRDKRPVNKRRDRAIHLVRSHQILPNGNILITDADKIMELTPNLRETVWQLSKVGVDMSKLRTKGAKVKGNPREIGFYKAERIPAKPVSVVD